ncbi:MAG: hypothetical protein KKG04_02340 [Candidatus Thermoplasmatota archaeon]|nr:hypothetical protein [Candidatus Thermoplasmatota archaeon]
MDCAMKSIWTQVYRHCFLYQFLPIGISITIGYVFLVTFHLVFLSLLPLYYWSITGFHRQLVWIADRNLSLFTGTRYLKAQFSYLAKQETPWDHIVVRYLWMWAFIQRPECRLVMIRKWDKTRQQKRVQGNYIFLWCGL